VLADALQHDIIEVFPSLSTGKNKLSPLFHEVVHTHIHKNELSKVLFLRCATKFEKQANKKPQNT
jgi:hypothetical protein